jgi:simple sugar transport system ATP-binding protein
MTMTMTEPASVGTADRKSPVLVVEGLSKRYGAIKALSDVSFDLYPGEVVGVLGDNGAGKSTLVNILAGAIPATHGRIVFEGTQADIQSPRDAHLLGIEAVYQDLALAKDLSVWQNIFLGNEQMSTGWRQRIGWLDKKAMAAASTTAVVSTGIKLASVQALCGRLSGGQRQTTAITAAFTWAKRVLLLDEPTSALGPRERQQVNALIRAAAERDLAVLLVSQDLTQVEEVCDRSIVLRMGRVVADVARGSEPTTALIGYITGATVQASNSPGHAHNGPSTASLTSEAAGESVGKIEPSHQANVPSAVAASAERGQVTAGGTAHRTSPLTGIDRQPLLAVEGVTKHYGAVKALSNVSLQLYEGEILGLVGHNGAGKSTLVGILSGTTKPTEGRITLEGKELVLKSPIDAHLAGIETVYQDLALATELNGWQNVFLGQEKTRKGVLGRVGWLDRKAMVESTAEGVARTGIGVNSLLARCAELSGGQCQTLAVVRAMMWGQRVVLFDEPTSALGIEDQEHVSTLMRSLADRGMAVLLISHNLPRVHEVCDRLVVLRMGRVVAETRPSECTLEKLIDHITGAEDE